MAVTDSVRDNSEKVAAERELRVLEERLRHELLGVEERCELRDRVLRLRRRLGL